MTTSDVVLVAISELFSQATDSMTIGLALEQFCIANQVVDRPV